MPPSVTAIVLNWCNAPDTAACLASLAAASYDALTVLLVDNGSPDGSGEQLQARFPDLPYVQTGSNTGYTGGNNRGMAWALERGADYLLILNNDTVVDPSCVETLVRAAEETGAALVTPQILYFDEPDRVWYGGGVFSSMRALGLHQHENEPMDRGDTRRPITFACGCCFLIRADVARRMGGFDDSYFAYVEDLDLSLRLTRAGHAMWYEPRALVFHRVARNAPMTPFQIRQGTRNRRRLVRTHYRLADRLRFLLWFYPTRLVHLARYIVTGRWACAAATLDGLFGALPRGDARSAASVR